MNKNNQQTSTTEQKDVKDLNNHDLVNKNLNLESR